MALKKIYSSSNVDSAQQSSLLGRSNSFNISLFHNDFYTSHSDFWRLGNLEGFTGIMLENLSLNFQTDWNDAGGAIIGKKIESYVNSKFIKMLAGQSDAGFMPFICSDAWTQQKVSGESKPIQVQLKFRAFNDNRLGCTNYNDIIKFLIHICSPIKSSSSSNNVTPANKSGEGLGEQIAKNLNNAAAGGSNIISTVLDSTKTLFNGFRNDDSDEEKGIFASAAKNLVETANSTYNKIVSTTGNGKNNGNFTILFSMNNKINQSMMKVDLKDTDNNPLTKNFTIDWIVDNFSFKPSRQFQVQKINDRSIPKPLWIDFDLTISTRLSLSNKYVYDILLASNETESLQLLQNI